MKSSVLSFSLDTTKTFIEVFELFHPGGKIVLNSTEWMGKEPRTCGVTSVKQREHRAGEHAPIDVKVTYKPKGYISFNGPSRYNGWDLTFTDTIRIP